MGKMLQFAGVTDCFSCSCGHTRTKGNFMKATFAALQATYSYLTPDLWKPTHFVKPPFQEFTDHLSQTKTSAPVYRVTNFACRVLSVPVARPEAEHHTYVDRRPTEEK